MSQMLRRSYLGLRSLLSTYAHGRSLNAKPLAQCSSTKLHPFCSPAPAILPIQFRITPNARKYSAEADNELEKENEEISAEDHRKIDEEIDNMDLSDKEKFKLKLGEYLNKYAGMSEEEIEKLEAQVDAAFDGEEKEIRFEDFEQEIKIFEDPFIDRQPPPEPDEKTKRELSELVETLKELVDQMPEQKPRKMHGKKGKQSADEGFEDGGWSNKIE
ncbi:uncharacterized protein LOC127257394 [Andrographis paniculata]|uniref:uncharacterized protein LOC127257394 n=1 Tax=Andrographis paniculata TaxID=175694 RepID=UPI0021E9A8B2|nr:uncharacterized protein LOC127257394 [Andrographis paniculata]XP_051139747.1 uncharacterized protein LOC127257394 [Andrographis paniculata]